MPLLQRSTCGRVLVMLAAAAVPLVAASCATGTSGGDLTDEGGTDANSERTVVPIGDSGPGVDGSNPGTDSGPGTCTGKVVINELRTGGAGASDEFVELYNGTPCAVPLTGWNIKYESAGGGTSPAGYKFLAGESIAAGAYFLVAGATFVGKKDAMLNPGFSGTAGQVGLVDDKAAVVDGVGYGTVTGGTFREKASAPAPASGKSIGRMPNGVDTNDNSADWKALTASSPGVAN